MKLNRRIQCKFLCFTAWKWQALWIAGRATGSGWKWYGRTTAALSTSDPVWYPSHPYSNNNKFCVAFYQGYQGIIQRECSTIYTYYPMCEISQTKTCSTGQVLSPVTNTCLRVVTSGMNWHQAKAHCEGRGEKLAVFDTKAAFDWFRSYSYSQGMLLSARACLDVSQKCLGISIALSLECLQESYSNNN